MYGRLNDTLEAMGACSESLLWTAQYRDARTAWRECTELSWMLWLTSVLGIYTTVWEPEKIREMVSEDLVIERLLARARETYDTPEQALARAPSEILPGDVLLTESGPRVVARVYCSVVYTVEGAVYEKRHCCIVRATRGGVL